MSQNFSVDFEPGRRPIKMWTRDLPVEPEAMQQLRNIASLPFVGPHVAVMPDVHLGKGATVGSVVPTEKAIIPAAVGVDIGCGMMATLTTLRASDLPDSLKDVRHNIERAVPVGQNTHNTSEFLPKRCDLAWFDVLKPGYEAIEKKHPKIAVRTSAAYSIGTLGGGNHFVELCLDEQDRVWIMLHSGSRGIGNRIGNYFITQAKEEMTRHFIKLVDQDLAYLVEGSTLFNDYVEAVSWAQDYAFVNRKVMMAHVIDALEHQLERPIDARMMAVNCHHNYISRENHFGKNLFVTRKGAVRAREGDLGIIPGSMGTRSFIVRGKGNAESFHSCSHGAGRLMSRTVAKKTFTLEDHIKATAGIECRKDEGVIDETPGAYKPIEKVMAAQADLVEIVHTLRQVLCVKG